MEKNRPTLLVAALIVDDNGRVLLSRHAPYYKWHLPDGEVQYGETLRVALARALGEDFHHAPRVIDDEPWFVAETIRPGGVHYVTHHFRAVIPITKQVHARADLETMFLDLVQGFSTHDVLSSTVAALDAASWRGLL